MFLIKNRSIPWKHTRKVRKSLLTKTGPSNWEVATVEMRLRKGHIVHASGEDDLLVAVKLQQFGFSTQNKTHCCVISTCEDSVFLHPVDLSSNTAPGSRKPGNESWA